MSIPRPQEQIIVCNSNERKNVMTTKEAIEVLSKLPQDAILMVPCMDCGGSVEVEKFKVIDKEYDPAWQGTPWVVASRLCE